MENKIKIPINGKVRVYWDDSPENYSKQGTSQIKTYFAKKYNLPRKSINVIFRPVKIDDDGNRITITGANLENVMDTNYQRQLFKEWLERENKNVNYDDIIKIDDEVNLEVTQDITEFRQRNYTLKWIKLNNFLCFGDVKPIHIDRLNGIVCVSSEPKNQGGKTSFNIDAPLFLFFGRTTKTDKNEEIFNQYTDKDTLVVRGMIEIDGEEFILERKMSRKLKKDKTWQITNTINYYRILPDGEEEPMNEEDVKVTSKLIKDTIGTEDDFMLTILATAKNLEDLIDSTSTEKGRLITRFVGLEVIEEKEAIIRKKYNEWSKTLKSNTYNIIDLETEISELEEDNKVFSELLETNKDKLDAAKEEIEKLEKEKESLYNKKQEIDAEILKLSPNRIKEDINKVTIKGKAEAKKLKEIKEQIAEIGEINFDEVKYDNLTKERRELEKVVDKLDNEIENLNNQLKILENAEICPTCNRKLDDVDNADEINKCNKNITNKKISLDESNKKLDKINADIKLMEGDKQQDDLKSKLELQRDKIDVDLSAMRNELKSLNNDQKRYNLNLDGIEFNKKIESDILGVNAKIKMSGIDRDNYISNIEKIKADITQNEKEIKDKKNTIEIIKKEQIQEKNYKVYIEMVGKKGISKIVLRSVLPIINAELHRLLDEVTDFDVEMRINDKNDVEFYIIKDGIVKKLKSASGLERTASSLALRFVLGQISSLPKPNFIAFDEIFGKVANENLESIKLIFDKASEMFGIIFIITHIDMVKDWADKIISVTKKDNISEISIQ